MIMAESKTHRYFHYEPHLKLKARELRKSSTLSEVLLWNKLKSGNMMGFTFNRQKPIGSYIVDFYCKKLDLVIEIDGTSHDQKIERDFKRQDDLEKLGLEFLRFNNFEIKSDIDNVLRVIENWIKEKTSP